MVVSKKIKLNDNIYYIIIDLEYRKKDTVTKLYLKDFGSCTKVVGI